MKHIHFILAAFLFPIILQSQDTLRAEDLKDLTYQFSIDEAGNITGQGAEFLKNELEAHKVVLLGEYHGSAHISKLTGAMMNELNELGCKNFVAEVGPISSDIINKMVATSDNPSKDIQDFVVQHGYDGEHSFPFFSNAGDKHFIDKLKEHQWTTHGIDQEYCDGFKMLIFQSFENLAESDQEEMRPMYTQLIDSLNHYYQLDWDDEQAISISVKNSKLIPTFLDRAVEMNPENETIKDALYATADIYYFNTTKKYLECNSSRIDYMKKNMKQHLKDMEFDFSNDRLLVKLGNVHTGRGFSPLSLYEVGNLLSELSEYHDQKSLHIFFRARYELMEDGEIMDYTKNDKPWVFAGKEITQMGDKDLWTIVDLRPLRYKYFYSRQIVTNWALDNMMKSHDLVIIPPTEKYY